MGEKTPLSFFPLSRLGHDLGRSFSGKGNTRAFSLRAAWWAKKQREPRSRNPKGCSVCAWKAIEMEGSACRESWRNQWGLCGLETAPLDEAVLSVDSGSPLALWEILMVRLGWTFQRHNLHTSVIASALAQMRTCPRSHS